MGLVAAIDHGRYAPEYLRGILERTRTIAVVGASPEPWRASYGVSAYLKRAGYRIIPVNPTALGERVHGEAVVGALADIGEPIGLVNVFRRPDFLPVVVEEAIAVGAPALWMQLGIRHDGAKDSAEAAGIAVVMDRCISVEHRRLFG
jgi:predicted CoA-binding protein